MPHAIEDQILRFRKHLRRRGLKLTSQRATVAREVFGTLQHFSAEELLDSLRQRTRAISKATVYRTLLLLEEARLITSIDFQRGYKLYERTHLAGHEHHEHVLCLGCDKIVEFQDPELETFHERIAKRLGFRVVSHTYKIFGLCEACDAKSDKENAWIVGKTTITR